MEGKLKYTDRDDCIEFLLLPFEKMNHHAKVPRDRCVATQAHAKIQNLPDAKKRETQSNQTRKHDPAMQR